MSFTPSSDVAVILNALLDKFENRSKRAQHIPHSYTLSEVEGTHHAARSIKILLTNLPLPSYFSQTDPEPRIIANNQLRTLEQSGLLRLAWLPGETNHLLHSITLKTEDAPRNSALPSRTDLPPLLAARTVSTVEGTQALYTLLNREPLSNHLRHLESLLLAEKFRFQKDDWRARALDYILNQLSAGKSPSPFSLTDSDLTLDLLALVRALSTLTTETPYRVFSVRVFNDSKRFEDLKPYLVRLARRANPEWKSLNNEDLLRELNLVANPGYIHLSGNWELTDINGQIISLDSFRPSVGFPASQIASIERIAIRAKSVLCIENLTSFHEFLRANIAHPAQHATICLRGNPSPSIRHLLRLIPKEIPIQLWSDIDYGGFNILAQLRKQVSARIQPYLMDIATFEKHAHLSRPLTQTDRHNLKRVAITPSLKDVHPTIEHILKRGLKLEQEAIQI